VSTDLARPDQAASAEPALVEQLRIMLRIRQFEERCAELYSAAKIRGFLHLYVGEEAVAAGVIPQLGPDDSLVSTYREHGHALARGVPMRSLMAEMLGKVDGCSHGRGGSMHLFDAERHFFGGNAIVAGGIPLAIGLALADQMQGRDRVTACFFGDGAVAEGAFHESVNLAALWNLPVLFCCENNRYAMGTALSRSQSQTSLALKAAAYEVPAWPVNGMDVEAVAETTARAIEMVRGGGPLFLELETYRFRAHSMFDPDRYRPAEEVADWKQHDPIPAARARLAETVGFTDQDFNAMEAEVGTELDDAVRFAEAADLESPETLTRWVYSERNHR
jgi:pyruvate dehydrogenase E1 component alpha subunit